MRGLQARRHSRPPPLCTPRPLRSYTPDTNGRFAGQSGYGYQSIARFVQAAAEVTAGALTVGDVQREGQLALLDSTLLVTAILEGGRRSLDAGGAAVAVEYDAKGAPCTLRVLGAA